MPDEPDAALIAACTDLDAALKQADELEVPIRGVTDETIEAYINRLDCVAETISRLPATTPAGLRAKAQAVIAYLRWSAPAWDLDCEMALSLARDILEAR